MSETRPKADPTDIRQIAPKWWQVRSPHPLRYILHPGYFDSCLHCGLGVDDRLELIAMGEAPVAHATLAVDSIGNESGARVKVSVLVEYVRTKIKAAA
jgi:hypothetical protein